jgi:two-component system phosphate regulon sensor histidine kinase PhoR
MKVLIKSHYWLRKNLSSKIVISSLKFAVGATIVPALVVLGYVLYVDEEVEIDEFILIVLAIFSAISVSVIPLFKDFDALTRYLSSLSLNRVQKIPKLQTSKTLIDLVDSIKILSQSWEKRKLDLNHKIIESKLVFENIPDIIIVVNSDFIITKSNDQISSIYDKNPIGESIKDVIKDQLLEAAVRWVFHDGIGKQIELEITRGDKKKFFIAKIESYQISEEDKAYAVVVLQDITEIKRTEKMFADFVANVSHEIKTPLAGIIGVVETIEHAGDIDQEALEEMLPILKSQSRRMSNLIQDLLSLAQIEKLQNTPPDDEVDLEVVLNIALQNLDWLVKQSGNQIIIKKQSPIHMIYGDQAQLVQVFENLITNAIKYGGESKKIYITYGHITPKISKKYSRGLYFSVKDMGDGIPKKYLNRLTERFFRVDKSRSNKKGGTGLGLAIVKQILTRHEAVLDIKSGIGKGSTFTVIFPERR